MSAPPIPLTTNEVADMMIGSMLSTCARLRHWTRDKVVSEMCSGSETFDHIYRAICERLSVSRSYLNERISQFIEAEKEEQAERAIRIALAAEVDA